jgi:transposase InsO family protein
MQESVGSTKESSLNKYRNTLRRIMEIEKAFTDYYECRPHSSIDYLPPRKLRKSVPNSGAADQWKEIKIGAII